MLGEALAYPFVLLRRRPVTVVGAFIAGLLIAAFAEYGWVEAIGWFDQGEANTFHRASPLLILAYYPVRAIAQSVPVAVLFVAAAIDLDLRPPQRRFGVGDAVRIGVLTALYVVVFVAPLQFIQSAIAEAARQGLSFYETWITSVPAFLIQSIALSLFFLSWPRTIATERISIFPTWRLGASKLLAPAGAMFAIALCTSLVSYAGAWVNWLAFYAHGGFVEGWLAGAAISEWPRLLGVYLIDAASVLIYARVIPPKPERVADQF